MDSLSQIVLGASVGEAVLGKKVGNKALLWGAIAGTIPDLDTIPGQFMDTVSRLEIHRGFSHSLVFAILMAPMLGFLIHRLYFKKKESDWWGWTQLFFWSIVTHPLLDIFTTWGTQFFWPLDWRIAIESIFVIDPLYTLPFLICTGLVLFFKRSRPIRARINRLGLIISSLYLTLTLLIKWHINGVFRENLKDNQIEFVQFNTRPSPFNTILWTCNVELEDRFLIGYYSLLDEDRNIRYTSIPKNHELLLEYRNNEKIERLLFLTKGFYALSQAGQELEMYDLRFGLTEGFDQGKGDFVFTYLIQEKEGVLQVEQKENDFEGIEEVMEKLVLRIKGQKDF